jgi:hypothetical protein
MLQYGINLNCNNVFDGIPADKRFDWAKRDKYWTLQGLGGDFYSCFCSRGYKPADRVDVLS